MKRAIVNSAQFVRYLADRVSIKLTQFAMKNSAGERFECGKLFLCLQSESEQTLSIPASALPRSPTLCIFRGDRIVR